MGHYKIAFFELYSDGQVQLNHSLTRTSSVHTYECRLIGYTQAADTFSVIWTLNWSQIPTIFPFPHDFVPRFKSRPACSDRPIVLQIESSHRCINQHRPSCHPCSVQRFLSPELPTTLRPRRLWQATGPDVKAIRTCSRCSYLSVISQTESLNEVSVHGPLVESILDVHGQCVWFPRARQPRFTSRRSRLSTDRVVITFAVKI